MPSKIVAVEPGSIARELDIRPGDELLRINGERVLDWIDYQALCATDAVCLTVCRDGELIDFSFEKDEYEPLGLSFSSMLISPVRRCANRCVFCFVDQLPPGARRSMRLKDDDWRLSLMMGNFVTLTNVSEREMRRIIKRRAAPLYVSVHTTDDDLRERMLGTPRARGVMGQLKLLRDADLSFHAQAVLCPGFNDGQALDRTIGDLVSLKPAALSLALVPVGLTKYRDGLTRIEPYTKKNARAVLDQVDRWRAHCMKESGSPFVHASDEFYLIAGKPFPGDGEYEDYPQIENGVGLCRLLEAEYVEAWECADFSHVAPARIVIATGEAAAPFLRELFLRYPVPGIEIDVRALKNGFFGDTVTAAGLLTGRDLTTQLDSLSADRLLITSCMLREGEDVFLDDMTLSEVERALKLPVIPVGRGGGDLVTALMEPR